MLWLLSVSGSVIIILDVNKRIGIGKTEEDKYSSSTSKNLMQTTKKKEFSSLANTNTTCAILEKEGWVTEMESKHLKTKERIQKSQES